MNIFNVTLALKMTTAQVVETSVTVTNSSFQNYDRTFLQRPPSDRVFWPLYRGGRYGEIFNEEDLSEWIRGRHRIACSRLRIVGKEINVEQTWKKIVRELGRDRLAQENMSVVERWPLWGLRWPSVEVQLYTHPDDHTRQTNNGSCFVCFVFLCLKSSHSYSLSPSNLKSPNSDFQISPPECEIEFELDVRISN